MCRMLMIFTIMFLVISLACCGTVNQSLELAACGSYAVPGMMCHDLKGNTFACEIKETDSYGRILFTYDTYNIIEEKNTKYYVICQRNESNRTFYYEDVCYMRYTDQEEALQNLKNVNAWNEPLKTDKMSERPINISLDLFLQVNTRTELKIVKDEFCRLAGISQDNISYSVIIDSNETGQELYVFGAEDADFVQKYLVLCDEEYNLSWMILDIGTNYEEKVVVFKRQNGWNY